jgi:hypothetical protein
MIDALTPTWMALTDRERTTIALLLRCKMPEYGWDRRFLRDLQRKTSMNQNQRQQLQRIARQHRKQLEALEGA